MPGHPGGPTSTERAVPRHPGGPTSTREVKYMVGGYTNTPDESAQASGTNAISMVEGSFPMVAGVSGEVDSAGGGVNSWTLQLNSQNFVTQACSGASGACKGWVQFTYQNLGSAAGFGFIESWLMNFGPKPPYPQPDNCPPPFSHFGNGYDCVTETPAFTVAGGIPITNLANLTLYGSAYLGGSDTAILSTGDGQLYSASQSDSLTAPGIPLALAAHWNLAEFNVFGEGNGSSAILQSPVGVSVVVENNVTMSDGTPGAPTCVSGGPTLEGNNLKVVPNSCCAVPGTGSLMFTESNITNAPAWLCGLHSEDTFYREKTCSIPSSGGFSTGPIVSVLRGSDVYIGEDFQPAQGGKSDTQWTDLGHGAVPISHPETATVIDSNGVPNIAVLYTGADHKIYEKHQVIGGSFTSWSSTTYAGLATYSAVAVVGGQPDENAGYKDTSMLIVAMDSNHQVYGLLSNGQSALSGWAMSPSSVFKGAPSAYSDYFGDYYVVGVDATTSQAFEAHFNPSSMTFDLGWYAEPGTWTFSTGASASYSISPFDYISDYLVNLGANNGSTPWVDTIDFTYVSTKASALAGAFDSAPSAGNSIGCGGSGCYYEPILTIHAQDGNCYWHDATDVSGEWTRIAASM
jgi:hypothetical protein